MLPKNDSVSIGPELPPHLRLKRNKNADLETDNNDSKQEYKSKRRVMGPTMPPPSLPKTESVSASRFPNRLAVEEDDFGPMPVPEDFDHEKVRFHRTDVLPILNLVLNYNLG